MADYINQNEGAHSIFKETAFGELPTGGVRMDLPTEAGQAALSYTQNLVEDTTQRPNRETAAPTRGHASSTGSFAFRMRPCAAIDTLIESAIGGKFDVNGLAFGGEAETSVSMISKLSGKAGNANNGFLGYQDSGIVATKWSISASAKEGVTTSFDLMGAKRVKLEADNLTAIAPVRTQGFNYINVKNITVAGASLKFTTLEFESGTPHDLRIVLGEKEGTSMAATANRETTLTLKGFRKNFDVDNLVAEEPVEVKFEISTSEGGYRVTLPYAMCVSPKDELTDTGLLVTLDFTAHFSDVTQSGILVEKLVSQP
jgi:hypothetical protein